MPLCEACLAFDKSLLDAGREWVFVTIDESPWSKTPGLLIVEYPKSAGGIFATHTSCELCGMLVRGLLATSETDLSPDYGNGDLLQRYAPHRPYSFITDDSTIRVRFTRCLRKLARLEFVLPGIAGTSKDLTARFRLHVNADSSEHKRRLIPCNFQSLDSSMATDFLKHTYDTCTGLHGTCCNPSMYKDSHLPTRVVEVGEDLSKDVKLISGDGIRKPYATLSHCWGSSLRRPLTTTTQNVESHMTSIAVTNLPKTFADVVAVTRTLRIPYLWIDSLYILQDDENDWKREAESMGAIFARSTLTIAASDAQNSTQGFLNALPASRPCARLPFLDNNGVQDGDFVISHATGPRRNPLDSILNTRAWVTQEWLLPSRIIHYLSDGMVWNCPTYERAGLLDVEAIIDVGIDDDWYNICTQYSKRRLTQVSDKLYALQGLANEVQKTRSDRYVAGIWFRFQLDEDDEAFGKLKDNNYLLWRSSGIADRHADLANIPKWSWASVDNDIDFPIHAVNERSKVIGGLSIEDGCQLAATSGTSQSAGIGNSANARRLIESLARSVANHAFAAVAMQWYGKMKKNIDVGKWRGLYSILDLNKRVIGIMFADTAEATSSVDDLIASSSDDGPEGISSPVRNKGLALTLDSTHETFLFPASSPYRVFEAGDSPLHLLRLATFGILDEASAGLVLRQATQSGVFERVGLCLLFGRPLGTTFPTKPSN